MADASKSFRPPKWCAAPRSPERHRQKVHFRDREDTLTELFDKPMYTIGKLNADIQLSGELASRMHAAVLQDVEGKRYLVDLKSTHGTFIEAKRLQPHLPAEWALGSVASFGSGPKADVLVFGSQASKRKEIDKDAVDLDGEPEVKRPRLEEAADPMAALYGDLPEATLVETAPKVETAKVQALPPPEKDPTKILFLDVDGVLRPLHSRQDAFQNTRTIDIGGAKVALLGNSEAKAGVDFWPSAMRALRFIIQKTGARICLSSDWRKSEELKDGIKGSFEEYDVPPLYSQTPDLDQATPGVIKALHSSFKEKRCKEIRKWLRQHPTVKNWCVVDDVDLSMPDKASSVDRRAGPLYMDSSAEFVKTNPTIGLNMDIAKLAICYINGAEPSEETIQAAYGVTG